MISNQKGVGLIEVLVSILILAIAVLGFSALQIQSIKSTTESVDRSQALLLMRSLAEKIRSNPNAITAYESSLNKVRKGEFKKPEKLCFEDDLSSPLCNNIEVAEAEIWMAKGQIVSMGIDMNLQPCPNTGGNSTNITNNIMYSYCLITSWGQTNPTIGSDDDPSDGSMDCLTSRDAKDPANIKTGGNYHPKASCMFLEIN